MSKRQMARQEKNQGVVLAIRQLKTLKVASFQFFLQNNPPHSLNVSAEQQQNWKHVMYFVQKNVTSSVRLHVLTV